MKPKKPIGEPRTKPKESTDYPTREEKKKGNKKK